MAADTQKLQATKTEFKQLVNMTPKQLEKWLATDDSQSVGIKGGTTADKKTSSGGAESTGHESGRNIMKILQKKMGEINDTDLDQMKRTVSYIKRHMKQKPSGDIENSRWRFSLMNWGHDPLKG